MSLIATSVTCTSRTSQRDNENKVKYLTEESRSVSTTANYAKNNLDFSPTKHLPSSHLPLPVEILDYVFQYFARDELLPFLRVNRAFYDISVRVLYRHIDGLHLHQSVACLLTLEKGKRPVEFVRSLEIGWEEATPTLNLYQLLHRVLQKLSGLNSLYIELPRLHSPTWVLSNCTFALHSFATSLPCNQELAAFLDLQPSIVELSLRGIHDSHSLPFLQTISSPADDPCEEPVFPLLPTSLPKLTQFRSIHGRPSTITTVISGRPIKMVSIPLFPSLATETLSALSTSSSSIRRLSIMSFDPAAPEFLLSEVVKRFPNLEALHIVILLTELSYETLKVSGPLLAGFRSLQYITFMAASDENAAPGDEQLIAKLWHSYCPTLKTIILPRGKVWFEGGMEWSAL